VVVVVVVVVVAATVVGEVAEFVPPPSAATVVGVELPGATVVLLPTVVELVGTVVVVVDVVDVVVVVVVVVDVVVVVTACPTRYLYMSLKRQPDEIKVWPSSDNVMLADHWWLMATRVARVPVLRS
jgi:uncharacterized membrane protein